MKLIILAAGKSSRIFNHIKKNKCLIKIKNITILENIIQNSIKNNISKIEVVIGYNPGKIIKSLKKYKNISFVVNKKYNTTDMVYSSILSLKNTTDDVIITYSDIFYNADLLDQILKKRKKNILVPYSKKWKKIWKVRKKDIFQDAETFKLNKKNQIIEIGNKITKSNLKNVEGQFLGLIYIPVKMVKPFIQKYKRIKQKKIQFTGFLNLLIKKFKFNIDTVKYNGQWYEFDDHGDLKNFRRNKLNV